MEHIISHLLHLRSPSRHVTLQSQLETATLVESPVEDSHNPIAARFEESIQRVLELSNTGDYQNYATLNTNYDTTLTGMLIFTTSADAVALETQVKPELLETAKMHMQNHGIVRNDSFPISFSKEDFGAGGGSFLQLKDGTKIFISSGRQRTFLGGIRIEVSREATDTAAQISQKLATVLTLLGIEQVAEPSAPDNNLQYQIDTQHGETHSQTIDLSHVEEREVFDGYTVGYEEAALQRYQELLGERPVLMHYFRPSDLPSIFREDLPNGLLSQVMRIKLGIKGGYGFSMGNDMRRGGGNNVFCRIFSPSKLQNRYSYSVYEEDEQDSWFIIDPNELNRTDWKASLTDVGGSTELKDMDKWRTPEDFFRELQESYSSINEVDFPFGISRKSLKGILVKKLYQRENIINYFRRKGIDQINGVPLEDFVLLHPTFRTYAQEVVTGLH